ncbi:hypothetical protein DIPPA_03863 [Diplonema papillatum]|nr:hypothetical protein DIPPA_03863 [Diplonema papillatum]
MKNTRVKEAAEVVDKAAGAAVVVAIFSGATAGERAVRMVLLTSGCFTSSTQEVPVPFSLDPLGLDFEHDKPLAALLGNCIIMAIVCTVSFVALKTFQRCGRESSFDLQGALRLPSILFLLGRLLYASSILAACRLLFDSRYLPFAAVLLLGAAAPVLLFRKLRQCVPKVARYVEDCRRQNTVRQVFIGSGEWVNVERGSRWVDSYGSVVNAYTEAAVWWTCFELCTGFALACVAAMETASFAACGHVKLTCAILCFLRLLCLLHVRPYARVGAFAVDVVFSLLEMAAMVLLAVGMYLKDAAGGENWAETAAASVIMPATVVWAAGLLLDLCTGAFVVCTGRRRRVQESFWDRRESRGTDYDLEFTPAEPGFALDFCRSPTCASDTAGETSGGFTHLYRDSLPAVATSLDSTANNLPSPFSLSLTTNNLQSPSLSLTMNNVPVSPLSASHLQPPQALQGMLNASSTFGDSFRSFTSTPSSIRGTTKHGFRPRPRGFGV